MIVFMIGCLLAIAYFIFKLVRVHDPTQASKYRFTSKYLTFFGTFPCRAEGNPPPPPPSNRTVLIIIILVAALSLFCVVVTFINALVCFLNFGKGLQEHIASNVRRTNGGADNAKNQPPADVNAPEKVDIEMVDRSK